jgi:carbonic anhydrase/acetyltransferase-like protein (isoleucine patch superfamily)
MLIRRNAQTPKVHPSVQIASSAQVIGNVTIGAHCYIDYNVVIESSGVPIQIEDHVIVLANTVIRSIGGVSRPAFPVHIGDHTLISPLCALAGCQIGRNCYIAMGVLIFQGAILGDAVRVGAGAIVHLKTQLPAGTHVGMRHIAAATEHGFLVSADVPTARAAIAQADFFETVFAEDGQDQGDLHSKVMMKLLQEVASWNDSVSQ